MQKTPSSFVLPTAGLPSNIFIISEDHHNSNLESNGPMIRSGDVTLVYSESAEAITHAKKFNFESQTNQGEQFNKTDSDSIDTLRFKPAISVNTMQRTFSKNLAASFSLHGKQPFVQLYEQPHISLDSESLSELLPLLIANGPDFRSWLEPKVWITSSRNDRKRKTATQNLTVGSQIQWAITPKCRPGDIVLLWTGGLGLSHILRNTTLPREAQEDEWGPAQANFEVLAVLNSPIKFRTFSEHEILKGWRLTKMNMQGAIKNQPASIADEEMIWPALRQLLEHEIPENVFELLLRIRPDTLSLTNRVLPKYNNDKPSGDSNDDHLGILADVRTLAMLITAKAIKPPMAIGLFGPWGSGKSFFIQQVKSQVDQISEMIRSTPKKEEESTSYHGDICQIEFNAWHYSEGNLWASLVDHLFTELRKYLQQVDAETGDEKLKKLLEELQTVQEAKSEAETKKQELSEQLETVEKTLSKARTKLVQEQKVRLTETRLDIWKQQAAKNISEVLKGQPKELLEQAKISGLSENSSTFGDLSNIVKNTSSLAGRWEIYLRSLQNNRFKAFGLGLAAILLLLAVAAGPLVAELVSHTLKSDISRSITSLITQIGCAAGGVMLWLERQSPKISKLVGDMDKFLDFAKRESEALKARVHEAEENKHNTITKAEIEIEKLKSEIETASRVRSEICKQEIQLLTQLEAQRPEELLTKFIEGRANTKDYREKLGVLALVRRDFERLSDILVTLSEEGEGFKEKLKAKGITAEPKDLPRIDRIVLYIDDLDRCTSEKVVEVLRAVHLLLAFDLFTVVVAVDPAWVTRSVSHEHSELVLPYHPDKGTERPQSTGNGTNDEVSGIRRNHTTKHNSVATPADYLEKIFQIPFWVPRFDSDAAFRLVRGLIPRPLPKDDPTASLGKKSDDDASPHKTAEELLREADITPPKRPRMASKEVEPTSSNLEITELEAAALLKVAALSAQSPRQTKRFVNLYRLVKVSLDDIDLKEFLRPRDDEDKPNTGFEAVAMLIGLSTCFCGSTSNVFREIERSDCETVEQFIKSHRDLAERRDSLHNTTHLVGDLWQLKLSTLKQWIPHVERFSFAGLSRME